MDALQKTSFPFMKLPAELRDIIYRYLLSPEYSKVKVKGFRGCTSGSTYLALGITISAQTELTQFYEREYHTQILRTSKEIFREAGNVFFQRNLFVTFNNFFQMEWAEENLPILTRGEKAVQFAGRTTEITLRERWQPKSQHRLFSLTLLAEDLPILVTEVLENVENLRYLVLDVKISENLGSSQANREPGVEEDFPNQSIIKRLLDPLCGFRGIQSVHSTGPIPERYKARIASELVKRRPTLERRAIALCNTVQEANEIARSGKYAPALSKYRASLALIARLDNLETPKFIRSGQFAGQLFKLVKERACFRMASGLCDMYLRLENFDEAYRWAFAALEAAQRRNLRKVYRLENGGILVAYMRVEKASEKGDHLMQACDGLRSGFELGSWDSSILPALENIEELYQESE